MQVPVYSVCSFASLFLRDDAVYIEALRDCFEAWVLYNFMALMVAYGKRAI